MQTVSEITFIEGDNVIVSIRKPTKQYPYYFVKTTQHDNWTHNLNL